MPGVSDGKVSAYNAGDLGSIPGSGRSPGEGNGNSLQYSCLERVPPPMDGGAWWASVYGVAQSRTRLKRLSSSSSILQVRLSQFPKATETGFELRQPKSPVCGRTHWPPSVWTSASLRYPSPLSYPQPPHFSRSHQAF